jgi:hypothetical protein
MDRRRVRDLSIERHQTAALLIVSVVGSLLVYDSTRSLAYCLPAVLIARRGLRGCSHFDVVAGCCGLAGLLIPAVYVEGIRFWIL